MQKNGTNKEQIKTVAIAGATGFIGSRLCSLLSSEFHVIALSRGNKVDSEQITWRQCDLYSLESCASALTDVDAAVYLVHSMMPSARLTQAKFEDLDLILADNFARAAERNNIDHIVYVGGLDPETPDTSVHLSSRMEVEQVLSQRIKTVTALRAGLVIGAGGSSYEILEDVVQKLPIILCPDWTNSKMQPIGLEDLLVLIRQSLLESGPNGCHDVGSHEIMTYRELMERAAEQFDDQKKPLFLAAPINNAWISSVGVRLLTGKPVSLILPLLQSLKHDMLTRNTDFQERVLPQPKNFSENFSIAMQQKISFSKKKVTKQRKSRMKKASAVRSVQRMIMPKNKDAFWVAEEYVRWLPKAFQLLVRAEYPEEGVSKMYLQGTRLLLLELRFQSKISSNHRAIYKITDGLLVRPDTLGKGIFEFRILMEPPILITAIHNFYPRLPWFVYTLTQAQIHRLVMDRFAKYLLKIDQLNT